eukprot:TRINITY_DN2620_c1_g1_i1.p1 TRINITY_DN2620_c1_g1~~TRINITY_DN2620_c1_g1_i1.p1  ORF type:complete len:101 (+),score=13.97 TRINITY_DN2620_c1_g1_i1:255-557(+)
MISVLPKELECGVTFESDSRIVISAVNDIKDNLSSIWGVIENIKTELLNYTDTCCVHVNRGANAVADALAKGSLTHTGAQIWLEDTPAHVLNLVTSDLVH